MIIYLNKYDEEIGFFLIVKDDIILFFDCNVNICY